MFICIPRSNPYQDNQTTSLFLSLNRTLNSRQERLGVRTHDLLDLVLVLEDQECGHGADAELLRNVRDLIDIELDEMGAGEFLREPVPPPVSTMNDGGRRMGREYVLHDLRSNDFAGTAPGCKGIENDDLVFLKSGLELGFAVHHDLLAISSIAT
jgi:hypothetical protein